MTATAFRFHTIRKRYGQRLLLDVDAIDLRPGSCTALVGSNGAGKTTLLKIMAGLEAPEQAWLRQGDAPEQSWAEARHALRHNVVYLHQFPYMFDASVAANVGYGLSCAHVPHQERHGRIRAALALVGVEHLIDAAARRLSGGERQRAALARALVLQPQLLLLDEPTASMDPEAREQTVQLLGRLKEHGICTVIVTHDISTLGNLPDVQLRLRDGHLSPIAPAATATRTRFAALALRIGSATGVAHG